LKAIVALTALLATFVLVGTAVGRIDPDPETGNPVSAVPNTAPSNVAPPQVRAVKPKPVRKTESVKVRPLVLPDFDKLTSKMWKVDRRTLSRQYRLSSNVVQFWTNPDHRWLLAPRQAKCWDVPWQRTCTVARASFKLHSALKDIAKERLDHEIPLINDWRTAVSWVQRIYPGTESWMLSISDREGGWGPWVWYGGRTWSGYHVGNDFLGADTVGGWMQFRYSTFAPYWRGAQKDLRQRGYLIPQIPMPAAGGPSEYAAWLSPLGQALTAGYMRYYGKDGCHWCL